MLPPEDPPTNPTGQLIATPEVGHSQNSKFDALPTPITWLLAESDDC